MRTEVTAEDITWIKADAIIIYIFEGAKSIEADSIPVDKALNGAISELITQGEIKGKPNEITMVHSLGRLPAGRVVITGLGKRAKLDINTIRSAIAETCRWLRPRRVATVATLIPGASISGITPELSAQAVAEGAMLGLYRFRKHTAKKNKEATEIRQLYLVSGGQPKLPLDTGLNKGKILAETTNLVRDMVNEPANYMTPTLMAEAARRLAADSGLEITILERDQIEEEGMGCLLGVAQGSEQPPKFIILRYRGGTPHQKEIVLVGKGITFDSGGISIKPSENMDKMKGDMSGGAVVMGTISAITRLKARINVTALVPATENLPSGSALKPGDVLTAMNGRTVEVISTDAEGRLALADALSYARKLNARYIIDVATLTGACRIALGEVSSGGFTNNQELLDKVIKAGKDAGEFIWQLPMYDEYAEQLKSEVADTRNVGTGFGGAITAAKFLSEFVDGTPWVHLDIAGTSLTNKERGHLVKGATGVMLRTLVNFVLSLAE